MESALFISPLLLLVIGDMPPSRYIPLSWIEYKSCSVVVLLVWSGGAQYKIPVQSLVFSKCAIFA